MIAILAFLEAEIDFNDQDLGETGVLKMISHLIKTLNQEIDTFQHMRTIKEGLDIAIIGPPNVGKSTLINCLSKREVSLTSRIAGTTRDIIESRVQMNGVFVTFLDTAGLRKTNDTIEKKGIAMLRKRLKSVAFNIFLVSKESDLKSLGIKVGEDDLIFKAKADKGNKTIFNGVSGKTGLGVREAFKLIEERLPNLYFKSGAMTTHRQQSKILGLREILLEINQEIKSGLDVELVAEKARNGLRLLEELTGRIDTEEVLGIIFNSFCIGK